MKSVRVRHISDQLGTGGWWVIVNGTGSNGQAFEYTCCDRLRPFASQPEAIEAANWVASHYLNDDGSPVPVIVES